MNWTQLLRIAEEARRRRPQRGRRRRARNNDSNYSLLPHSAPISMASEAKWRGGDAPGGGGDDARVIGCASYSLAAFGAMVRSCMEMCIASVVNVRTSYDPFAACIKKLVKVQF